MQYITAAAYDSYIDAHIAMGMLEAEQVNCWLKDENTVTIDPLLTFAVGGIKVMVPEVQAARAIEILQQAKKSFQQQNACPQCGSTDVEYISTPRKPANWLSAIASYALGIGAAIPVSKVYHCFHCNHEFLKN